MKELNQLKETISLLIEINDLTDINLDSEFISGQNKAFNTVLVLIDNLHQPKENTND